MENYKELNYKKRFNSLCRSPRLTISDKIDYFIALGTISLCKQFKSEIENKENLINFIQSQILWSVK